MAGGTHSGVMRAQWRPQSVEYSSRTPWEKDVDLLQPMLISNCRKDEPETSKSQLSAYRGFSVGYSGDREKGLKSLWVSFDYSPRVCVPVQCGRGGNGPYLRSGYLGSIFVLNANRMKELMLISAFSSIPLLVFRKKMATTGGSLPDNFLEI